MNNKKIIWITLVCVFVLAVILSFSPPTADSPESRIYENEILSVKIPEGWEVFEPDTSDGGLILEVVYENGMANISIDNDQYFLSQPNSKTITEHTTVELLEGRFQSIEESVKSRPDAGWSNFEISDEPKTVTLNIEGVNEAAEGSFIVDEDILGEGSVVNRKIKRTIIFTRDDLLNIVFASTNSDTFEAEYEDFKILLNSLSLK